MQYYIKYEINRESYQKWSSVSQSYVMRNTWLVMVYVRDENERFSPYRSEVVKSPVRAWAVWKAKRAGRAVVRRNKASRRARETKTVSWEERVE